MGGKKRAKLCSRSSWILTGCLIGQQWFKGVVKNGWYSVLIVHYKNCMVNLKNVFFTCLWGNSSFGRSWKCCSFFIRCCKMSSLDQFCQEAIWVSIWQLSPLLHWSEEQVVKHCTLIVSFHYISDSLIKMRITYKSFNVILILSYQIIAW